MPVVNTANSGIGNNTIILFDNLAAKATVSATSTAAGYPAIATIDPATWSSWRPTVAGASAQYDMGSAVEVDCVGIAAHDAATSGVTLWIEVSTNGTTWTQARPGYAPLTNEDLILPLQSQSFRYWRIRQAGGICNIGVVFIGKRLTFNRSPIDTYTPLHHARQYTKLFNDSIKGQFLGNRVMAAGAETDVDMGMFDRSWLEGNIRPFEYHYNQGGCFFYAGSPLKYPLDMGYCRALGDDETLAIEWNNADRLASLSFGVRSYVG